MQEYLIVDGYNMIGAWPELIKLAEIRLEEARDRLIGILADYQGYSGFKVVLVFDAYQVPGLGGNYRQHQLDIVYTKEKETADEAIERLVTSIFHRRRRIYVATSDMVEQHVIFGKGALRISARELLTLLSEERKEMKQQLDAQPRKLKNSFSHKLPLELRGQLEKWRRGDYS